MWAHGRVASYALCFLVFQVKLINSRTSWRLSADRVIKATQFPSSLEDDPVFDILATTANLGGGQGWSKTASSENREKLQVYCNEYNNFGTGDNERRFTSYVLTDAPNITEPYPPSSEISTEQFACATGQQCDDIVLDCGKPVNFTYYDNLVGVANRNKHPLVPEPHVALMFKKNSGKVTDVDIDLLERRLKKAKKEKPKSVQLYNQIGNFWRIKGNAQRSIECFRRALAVSPHNAEVLLNLARVLLVLQYLDDATYLARRSLELQPPDRNAWEQYLTLGQIFKAYGHFQEAAVHLRHALELKPDLTDAAEALKEVESLPAASIHIYTLLIIVCLVGIEKNGSPPFLQKPFLRRGCVDWWKLGSRPPIGGGQARVESVCGRTVLGVLLVVLSSIECDENLTLAAEQLQRPVQRHFNRAMAMRSLRLNVSRNKRC